MDLNGFKEINDRLGHEIGDALLVSFADRLERACRRRPPRLGSAATSSRCCVRPAPTPSRRGQHRGTLHTALPHRSTSRASRVTIGVSIGVASAPDDGRTGTDLLRAADVAMYKAKRCGSPIEYYDNCVKSPQHGRLNLLSELSDALTEHQLHIHFQPQLRMVDGSVDTVEALIRWQHPRARLRSRRVSSSASPSRPT